jgi:hypothetical protein
MSAYNQAVKFHNYMLSMHAGHLLIERDDSVNFIWNGGILVPLFKTLIPNHFIPYGCMPANDEVLIFLLLGRMYLSFSFFLFFFEVLVPQTLIRELWLIFLLLL